MEIPNEEKMWKGYGIRAGPSHFIIRFLFNAQCRKNNFLVSLWYNFSFNPFTGFLGPTDDASQTLPFIKIKYDVF